MKELEQALGEIVAALPVARAETIALAEAHGRYLAEPIRSPIDLPVFDNSAMDGYAVCANDLKGAKAEAPITLRLIGRVIAGEIFSGLVEAGTCVRIFTGSPFPPGADAVVMQEDASVSDAQADHIRFFEPIKPWENVRLRGEDVKAGAIVAEQGMKLTAGRINLLAAVGVRSVSVGTVARVGLLATGSELIEAVASLTPGKIFESNRQTLALLIRQTGAKPAIYPIVEDSLAATRAALETAFAQNDFVITSGGVSVGEMDFVKEAFETLGGRLDFWKINMRPGRPFVFGRWGEKFLFGLPGNPVSAFTTFLLLARPALLRWQGAVETGLLLTYGVLAEPLANHGARRHFLRVTVDGAGKVRSAGLQGSHAMMALAQANGLLDVPAETTLHEGQTVTVLHWE